jgi:TRAP-type C4-dicarboxylate transport system permease small subunit
MRNILKALMVVSLALMCILVFLNVVLRYGFNSNILVTEELARYLFVWLIFLGSISAFSRNHHIRVQAVLLLCPEGARRVIGIFSQLAMLLCCGMVLKGCWELALLNQHNLLPVSGIPVAVLYFAGIPFSVCVGVILLCRLWHDARQIACGGRS